MNHEWTRMNTNVRHESTEYTKETECLAAGADNLLKKLFIYYEI